MMSTMPELSDRWAVDSSLEGMSSELPLPGEGLRVAHVLWGRCNPESANGVDKSVYFLSMHQARLGADVAVFSISDKEPLPIPGVEVLAFPSTVRTSLGFRLPFAPKLLTRELLAWRPDVVHLHSLHIGPFVGLGRRLNREGILYVVTPHGALAPARLSKAGYPVQAYLRTVERGYLRHAAFVHAVGSTDVAGVRAIKLRTRVVLVQNGIDITSVPCHVEEGLLAREFPQLAGRRVLLFLGRLDPDPKGLDILLEGLARCDISGLSLVMVGPDVGGSTLRIRMLIDRLGLAQTVLLLGPAYGEKKWAYLASADVFVHSSRREAAIPFSVMEALAAGRPMLLCRPADPEGAVEEAGAGIVVDPTVDGVCAGLKRVIDADQAALHAMGRAAQDLAKHFDWSRSAGDLLEAYRAQY
ncbi:MAG: glycosyltransferase [Actinomycetota bacterium]